MTTMHQDTDQLLESICALLRWFDHTMLTTISQLPESQVNAFLLGEHIVEHPEHANSFELSPAYRSGVSARLRANQSLYLTLRKSIFEYFLDQLQQKSKNETVEKIERECFYHFEELFILLIGLLDWTSIAKYTSELKTHCSQGLWQQQRLTLYDGYVAIRTQKYAEGEELIQSLFEYQTLEPYVTIHSLNALAQSQWYQANYDKALDLFERLRSEAKRYGNQIYEAVAMINMGIVYKDLGFYSRAYEMTEQSLAIFRTLDDHYREAHALYELGNNALSLGRLTQAQDYFQQAFQSYSELNVPARLATLHWSQGFMHQLLGEVAESEQSYLQAIALAQSPEIDTPSVVMDSQSYLGLLYQSQGHYDRALQAYDAALELAHNLKNEDAINNIMHRRGNVLERQGLFEQAQASYSQAINGIEELRSRIEGEEIKMGIIGTTQLAYESIILFCLAHQQAEQAFDYVERARSRAFLDVLSTKNPELYDSFAQDVVKLADIQAQLPPNSLLLEYYTVGVLPRGEHMLNHLPAENVAFRQVFSSTPKTILFAISQNDFRVFECNLDPNKLRPQINDPSPIRRLLRGRVPAQLYEQLLAPASELIAQSDLVYIIPHGPLHYVPFSALFAAQQAINPKTHFPALAQAPSATVLLRSCLGRPIPEHIQQSLAIGYNDPEGTQELRYAESEAQHIAGMLGGVSLVGDYAKFDALRQHAPQTRWLHISGHAYYYAHDPLASELKIGPNETLNARTIASELDLNAELITLSSCTSGVAQIAAGDEQLGLQRAFLYAGARAILCSLWEAADFVALLLMDQFYRLLKQGVAPAFALWQAQMNIRSMNGLAVSQTIERWRIEDPNFVAQLDELPTIPPEQYDTLVYQDPIWWAPFILIGKAN
jgi:CHAT domain-containing protein/tetratricopeptide (TPR) repeat protein